MTGRNSQYCGKPIGSAVAEIARTLQNENGEC